MKQLFNFCSMLIAALFMFSCGPSLKVTSDYDKSIDFQQYKSFSLDKSNDSARQSVSSFNQERITNAVRSEMIKKSFQESSSPDLIVHTAVIMKDMQSVTANTNYYGYGGYYRPYGWGGGMSTAHTTYDVQNYKDGSLIIDVVDTKTQKLVWEGVGNKQIDKPSKDLDKAISDAIASIMESFPPGKKK